MVNQVNSCQSLVVSWLIIVIGSIVYVNFGLAASFFAFALAAYIRREQDRQLFEKYESSRSWFVFLAMYYLCLLILALVFTDLFYSMLGVKLAIVMCFPLIVLAMFNDVLTCIEKTGSEKSSK